MKRSKLLCIISMFLAIFMLVALISGCTGSSKDSSTTKDATTKSTSDSTGSTDKTKDPYKIKVFVPLAGPPLSTDTEIGKIIEEKFNITFEFILRPANYNDQCNIYLSAGDYPEVFYLPTLDIYHKYVNAGALICLEEYLDKMSNFTKNRADQIPLWRTHSPDGKLYKWENASPQSPAAFMDDFDVMVRTDVLEKQGWPETIYASDYIDFLKQGLKDFPTTDGKNTVGLTFAGAETWGCLSPFNAFEKGDTYFSANKVCAGNIKNKSFEYKYGLSYTKEAAKFFNILYREGLLDKESYSLKDTDCLSKMTTGQAIMNYYGRWNTIPANDGLIKNNHPERQYIELPFRLDSQKGQKRQFVQQMVRTIENIVMTKNCKYPERYIELVDWWQTDEAQKLYGTGVENVDYKMENGKRVPLKPLENYLKGENPDWAMKTGTLESFLFSGYLGGRYDNSPSDNQPYRITKDPDIIAKYGLTERQKEAYKALGWKHQKSWYYENGEFHYDGLMAGISIDPTSDLGKKATQIGEIAAKYSSKIVFSKNDDEFEKNYQDMLNEMEKQEPQKIVDEYNRLLEAAKAKVK